MGNVLSFIYVKSSKKELTQTSKSYVVLQIVKCNTPKAYSFEFCNKVYKNKTGFNNKEEFM